MLGSCLASTLGEVDKADTIQEEDQKGKTGKRTKTDRPKDTSDTTIKSLVYKTGRRNNAGQTVERLSVQNYEVLSTKQVDAILQLIEEKG